jgi:hypothetical protein
MATTAPTATKRCPGFAPGAIAPHELAATLENFNSNKGSKDGLSTRCRVCGNLYGKAWAAAKKQGEKFSVRANPPLVAVIVEEPGEELQPGAAQAAAKPATLHVEAPSIPQYADVLAMRAGKGRVKGYTLEQVGGLIYALPVAPQVVASEEGQAALELVNQARAADRRKRDAERKRAERAAKKARAAEADASSSPGTSSIRSLLRL